MSNKMSHKMWKHRLLSSTVLGMSLIVFSPLTAKAQVASGDNTAPTVNNEDRLLGQLEEYSQEQGSSIKQVTNVNQLRDVSPTDWAYEALRSLVDRYGCIAGFPNQTYRGGRALSRYEFAAGLNSCLNQIERLIASSEAVLREDIDTINRLAQEFEAELAVLGGRIDNLESRTAFLEDNQFSTTTKLNGEAIIAVTNSFGSDNDNQAILADRVRLELNSSFTGEDRLVTRLAAGNFDRFTNDFRVEAFDTTTGELLRTELRDVESSTTTQTFNLFPGSENDVSIDWLGYYTPIRLGNFNFDTYVAGFGGIHSDYAATTNPYFEDFDGGNGALSTFASESPIYRIGGGGGAGVNFGWEFPDSFVRTFKFTAGYLAGGAGDPSEGSGLFNGDFGALAQFNLNFVDKVDLGLTYVRGFHKRNSPIFGAGVRDGAGLVGTAAANLSESQLSDAFAGVVDAERAEAFFDIGDRETNTYGAQLAWRITDYISFSGFFNYTDVKIRDTREDGEIWSYGGGFTFPDILKEGTIIGLFGGVQPYLGDELIRSVRFNTKNPVHLEAFFKYPVSDNISITPGAIYLINPEQTEDTKNQVIGTLRTTFTF